jgi:hypothetical protein
VVNDQAVLENLHSYMLHRLLDKHQILASLSPEERARFKKSTVEGILGTDMTKHFMIFN